MVAQHYRWDFVGLSTDTKPTPATSEKVVDGSTFYCSDTSKLYIFCKNNWYERKALGNGGGGGGGGDEAVKLLTVADATMTDPDTGDKAVEIWKLPAGVYRYEKTEGFYVIYYMEQDENEDYSIGDMSDFTALIVSDGAVTQGNTATFTVYHNNGISIYTDMDEHGVPDFITHSCIFQGTDGGENGTDGFVPAPLAEDAGKFLCADGTWQEAGGGGSYSIYDIISEASNNPMNYVNITQTQYTNLESAIIEGKTINSFHDEEIGTDHIATNEWAVLTYIANYMMDEHAGITIQGIDSTGASYSLELSWNDGSPQAMYMTQ